MNSPAIIPGCMGITSVCFSPSSSSGITTASLMVEMTLGWTGIRSANACSKRKTQAGFGTRRRGSFESVFNFQFSIFNESSSYRLQPLCCYPLPLYFFAHSQ